MTLRSKPYCNGIEYGVMAAHAEGLNILRNAEAGKRTRDKDAETTPLRNPEAYQYELDLPDIVELWRRGSVIGSWLLDLTAAVLYERLSSRGDADFANRVLPPCATGSAATWKGSRQAEIVKMPKP